MRKFLRSVRLDGSDAKVFHRAAESGELAVPGGFVFAQRDPDSLDAKDRQAFRNGWLGTESFGHATIVEAVEISEAEFFQVVEQLAQHFVSHYGAPELAAALPAAREEADYAASLADHKVHQMLAIEREPGPEGIIERVRVIRPERATDHAKIWQVVPDDGADP